jgi:hypothetical protein
VSVSTVVVVRVMIFGFGVKFYPKKGEMRERLETKKENSCHFTYYQKVLIMSQPLGRSAMRKTIKKLKQNAELHQRIFCNTAERTTIIAEYIQKEVKNSAWASRLYGAVSDLNGHMRSQILYICALEDYLSELDETFDKLFEEAKKKAEEEAKEITKRKPKTPII